MAIFARMVDVLKANINDLLDKAEDPEKMLKQIIIDMENHLTQATQGLGQVMAGERQSQKTLDDAKKESAMWEGRVKTALSAGNQDLAKQAVAKKLEADEAVNQAEKMHAELAAQVDTVRGQVDMLKQKLNEARQRENMLSARAQVAKARSGVAQAVGSVSSSGASSKMDKMEQKISGMEAQADAAFDVSGLSADQNDPFKELEKNKSVDDELSRIMSEMNGK